MLQEPQPKLLGEIAANLVEKIAENRKPKPIEDGIYFNLPEEAYHEDLAHGSGDKSTLAYTPEDYWFNSSLNPDREPEKKSDAMTFGTACHVAILYGREEFEKRYGARFLNGATTDGKAETAKIKAAGKIGLTADKYKRALISGAMVRSNPEITQAFQGGMSEVSVFWTRDGIRNKARLDYLKIRATTDLKSIANIMGDRFDNCCKKAISNRRYDVQAEHYRCARMALKALFDADKVSGSGDPRPDLDWLKKVVNQEAFAWVWVFYQSNDAPLTHGWTLSPGNPLYAIGRATIDQADANYRQMMELYGTDTRWVVPRKLEELTIEDLPPWFARD